MHLQKCRHPCYTGRMGANWNDLQVFLAGHDSGTLAGAARLLRVDETTVGRRLAALERDLGARLAVRKRDGYELTPAGHATLAAARPIQASLRELETSVAGADKALRGKVRLTMPESVATCVVLPRLPEFCAQHPEIQVEVVTSTRLLDIARREADVAIRMRRPEQGTLFAKRLGQLEFALYASRSYLGRRGPRDLLVDYPDAETTREEAALLGRLRRTARSQLLVTSRPALLAALQAGLGVGVLPAIMGDGAPGLARVPGEEPFRLDTWLAVHADLKRSARVRAMADFLTGLGKDLATFRP